MGGTRSSLHDAIVEHSEVGGSTMREFCFIAMIALLASGSVLAQPATRSNTAGQTQRSYEKPVDHGPFTPEASRAYQGGGMILEGAPGAPAPTVEPTPPGQTPRNSIPPR
jgi:hypothetical protein